MIMEIDFVKTYCLLDQTGKVQFVINGVKMQVSLNAELFKDLNGAYPLDGWTELEALLIYEFMHDIDNKQEADLATEYVKYFIKSLKANNGNHGIEY